MEKANSPNLTIRNSLFEANVSTGAGGGLAFEGSGNLDIQDSLFLTNTGVYGGGLFVGDITGASPGVRAVRRTTFAKNESDEGGGAGIQTKGVVGFVNSTFSQNIAQLEGGGVKVMGGSIDLRFSTLVENSSANGTQIYVKNETGPHDVDANILAGDASVCGGTVSAIVGANNLRTDSSCTHLSGPTPGPVSIQGLSPNGGSCGGSYFSCLTHKLTESPPNTSSACWPEDQRGFSRGSTPCWPGSYED